MGIRITSGMLAQDTSTGGCLQIIFVPAKGKYKVVAINYPHVDLQEVMIAPRQKTNPNQKYYRQFAKGWNR